MNAMTCSLCLNKKELVKSHIIPEAFFTALSKYDEKPTKLISNEEGFYPKRSPIGVYDENICCSDCEKTFGVWDDYAIKLFRDKKNCFKEYSVNGNLEGYTVNVDYKLLKLFFISVLWRAGASKHRFYSKVDLGPHQDKLRKMIIGNDPGEITDYSVFLMKFDVAPEVLPIISPWKNRIENIWHYNFVFYGYQAAIAVASHPLTKDYRDVVLGRSSELFILRRPYKGSNYHEVALSVANAQNTNVY